MTLFEAEIDPKNLNCKHLRGLQSHHRDYGIEAKPEYIRAHFKNLEETLIDYIEPADIVVGCAAWLTSRAVLEALAQKSGVSIVVQKEDFLRPDDYSYRNNTWKAALRRWYDAIPGTISRYDESLSGTAAHFLSYCHAPEIDAIRCFGINDHSKQRPLMHHKFMVFCKEKVQPTKPLEECNCKEDPPGSLDFCPTCDPDYVTVFHPYAVWTGSYNPTTNATRSMENAIYIVDEDTAYSYFYEWSRILSLSEPLNWSAEYIAPQWRVGS